jgi:hypothetical protein
MDTVILLYSNGDELKVTLNEDVLDSHQIVFQGTLFTYLKFSNRLPVFAETIQPHIVTIKRSE